MLQVIANEEIYQKVFLEIMPETKKFLWIGTADIKDLHVEDSGRMKPLLQILATMVKKGIEIRMIHAKEPGPRFREDFDRFPELYSTERFERVLCPRTHFKIMVFDGRIVYSGSANLTGAGMGARGIHKRNFETGFITDEPAIVDSIMRQFDQVFMGEFCEKCAHREICPDPIR